MPIHKLKLPLCFSLISVFLCNFSVLAESRVNYRSYSFGKSLLIQINTPEGQHSFKLYKKNLNSFNCSVDNLPKKSNCLPSNFSLYQGANTYKARQHKTIPFVAADVYENILSLNFYGRSGKKIYLVEIDIEHNKLISLRSLRSNSSLVRGCKTTTPHNPKISLDSSSHMRAISGSFIVSVATDADADLVKRFKGTTRTFAKIAAMINTAETMYLRSLPVSFNLTDQHAHRGIKKQPFKRKGSLFLLNQFRTLNEETNYLGDADLRILFTGKDLKQNVVGRAYQGVVCSAPSFSYALVQRTSPVLQGIVLAHEIGHTLGAGHDPAARQTIMSAVLSGTTAKQDMTTATSFSNFSRGEIEDHLTNFGECIAED